MSVSLRPHELQHARTPCPSPTPRVHSNSRPPSQWCHPAISSSVVPFSCPQSLPASKSFPMKYHAYISIKKFPTQYTCNSFIFPRFLHFLIYFSQHGAVRIISTPPSCPDALSFHTFTSATSEYGLCGLLTFVQWFWLRGCGMLIFATHFSVGFSSQPFFHLDLHSPSKAPFRAKSEVGLRPGINHIWRSLPTWLKEEVIRPKGKGPWTWKASDTPDIWLLCC